jgi:hypothetical protein
MGTILELLRRLSAAGVEHVVIGGIAARLHGSALPTEDLDVCCPMTTENMSRLLAAIGTLNPRFRLHPKTPSLSSDPLVLSQFRNLLLETDLGKLDVLAEVTGLGGFDEVVRQSVAIDVEGRPTRVLDLDALIAAKRAAGRTKDQMGLVYLEAAKQRRDERKPD